MAQPLAVPRELRRSERTASPTHKGRMRQDRTPVLLFADSARFQLARPPRPTAALPPKRLEVEGELTALPVVFATSPTTGRLGRCWRACIEQ